MSKFCSDCGKEILLGNKCIDCARKAQEEAEASANKIDYKKLTFRICLLVVMLTVAIVYVCITDNADEKQVTQNASQTDISDYEESKSTYYEGNSGDDLNVLVKMGEDGYRHFNITEREFVNTYNKLTSLKIQENNFETLSRSEYVKNMGENDPLLQRLPNIHMLYSYVSTRPYSIGVWCDSKDNLLCASVSCWGNFRINSEDERNEFLVRCIFVYAALTGEDNDTAQQVVVEAYNAAMSGSSISDDLYETYFSGTLDAPIFGVRVVNN